MTHLLLILLLLLLFPSSFSLFSSSSLLFSSSYDPLLAKEAWIYSIASYCNADRLKTWDIADLKVFYPDMKDISVFYSSTGDNQGFVGFNEKTNLVVMAFRGSSSIENWMENIDLIKTNYFRCNNCEVHEGFNNAYMYLSDQILPAFLALSQKYYFAKLLITGHSLGGAIATLSMLDAMEMVGKPIDYFYTFGSPRVGNAAFADYLNQKLKISKSNFLSTSTFNARITHYKDPVPHLLLSSLGFKHIDLEIYYEEDNNSYSVCQSGEDENCSNQHIMSISIKDHLDYMGVAKKSYDYLCK